MSIENLSSNKIISIEDKNERKAYKYNDMDFWHDNDLSLYRPWITLNQLLKHKNFTYIKNSLVVSYTELDDKIEVNVLREGKIITLYLNISN